MARMQPRVVMGLAEQGGDLASEATLRALAETLYPFACVLAGSRAAGRDLLEDALSRAYERRGQLRDPTSLTAWARRILLTTFLDERRHDVRRAGRVVSLDVAEATSALDLAPYLDLGDALRRLPPADRVLLALHYWQGYTYAECGQEMGIPEGTAKSRIHASLAKLRTILKGDP